MGRPSKKLYNTGAICGDHTCPCGWVFTGYDERTRDKAKQLHKQKCTIGATTNTTQTLHIPNKFAISYAVVERYKEQLKRKNGQGTATNDVCRDD